MKTEPGEKIMSTITYRRDDLFYRVYSGGLWVGSIRLVEGGYAYFPKGSKVKGETFATIDEVKRSLEAQ
jgi:hypothetical protein